MGHMAMFAASILAGLLTATLSQTSLYDLGAIDVDGQAVALSDLTGNVSVVINVATF